MNHSIIRNISVIVAVALNACSPSAQSTETKQLEKTDATKLLGTMGYTDVTVAAVIHGQHRRGDMQHPPMSGDSLATIIAMGKLKGSPQQIEQNVFYDKDIGWFFYELTNAELRLWTVSGYKAITSSSK
jgi:hypothetical protein